VRTLEKDQRRLGRLEGQFSRVIGVVQSEGECSADLDRRQPDDLVLGGDPAIGQTQMAVVLDDGTMDGALPGDARVFHIEPSVAATVNVRSARPGASMRTRAPAPATGERYTTPTRRMSPWRKVMNWLTAPSNGRGPRSRSERARSSTSRPSTYVCRTSASRASGRTPGSKVMGRAPSKHFSRMAGRK